MHVRPHLRPAAAAAAGLVALLGAARGGERPADGDGFWAFRPAPRAAACAPGEGAAAIDGLVGDRLAEAALEPVGPAPPGRLVRRLAFDLTGLPPQPDVVVAFEADPSLEAYRALVDGMLASPQFGETWGRHWLDLARYADSNGGDINFTFYHAWRYRNYVIDAFNADKRFDEFVVEQVAGDLLDAPTVEGRSRQIVASGFLMVGSRMTSERDKEKMHLDIADEQLDTVGRVFMGMTLGCARCHDHKFDPVPAADYYAMAGIFHSTETASGIMQNMDVVSGWVEQDLPLPPAMAAEVAETRRRLADAKSHLKAAEDQLEKLKEGKPNAAVPELGVVVDDTGAEVVGAWKASTYTAGYYGAGYVHDDRMGKGEKAVIYRPELPGDGEYEVRLSYTAGANRPTAVPVKVTSAEGESVVRLDQTRPPSHLGLFEPVGRFRFAAGGAAEVRIETGGTGDCYVIADAVQFVPVTELGREAEMLAEREGADMQEAIEAAENEVAGLKETRDALEVEVRRTAPVAMAPRDRERPEDLAIRVRGEPSDLGEVVPRGFMKALPGAGDAEIPEGASGRLELARWIASADNPLTPRVYANRLWHHLFGAGLVRTVDNFGTLGDRPAHPELLDFLAAQLVASGWSTKTLVREIVLSETYRRDSRTDPAAAQADPENRLWWRQNRRPLTAEAVRDALLFASGELDLARPGGGPVESFGETAISSDGSRSSDLDLGALRVRSVYLPRVREDRIPVLDVFDLADPNSVVGRRAVTNVPAQALFFLNSKFVHERAEKVAALAGESGGEGAVERIFVSVLGRRPTADEAAGAAGLVGAEGTAALAHTLFASTEFRLIE